MKRESENIRNLITEIDDVSSGLSDNSGIHDENTGTTTTDNSLNIQDYGDIHRQLDNIESNIMDISFQAMEQLSNLIENLDSDYRNTNWSNRSEKLVSSYSRAKRLYELVSEINYEISHL